MKKTAMQLLIDKYEKEAKKTKSPTVQCLLEMVLNDIKEMKLLEKERGNLEEAYNCGNLDNDGFSPDKLGEQYYKETYQ